jgi:hypothetical protein
MMSGLYSSSSAWSVWLHLHCLFALMVAFAVLAGLVWLVKFANQKQLVKVMTTCLLVGALGVLLTAPFAWGGVSKMMDERWEKFEAKNADEDSVSTRWSDEDRDFMRDMMTDIWEEDQTVEEEVGS